jgi:hypothetical protein
LAGAWLSAIVLSDVVGPICIDVIVGQPIVVNNAG